jgi:membrane protein required for colicin V production
MNWLDVILLILLGLSTFNGLRRGLVKTVFSIIGVIVGIILASRFYDTVSSWFGFGDSAIFNIFAFILIVIIAMAAAAFLAKLVKTAVSAILLGWADRAGGAIFGLVVGALLLGALLSLLVRLFEPAVIADSAVASFLAGKFPFLIALLPSGFDSVRDFFTWLLF